MRIGLAGAADRESSSITNRTFWDRSKLGNLRDELCPIQ